MTRLGILAVIGAFLCAACTVESSDDKQPAPGDDAGVTETGSPETGSPDAAGQDAANDQSTVKIPPVATDKGASTGTAATASIDTTGGEISSADGRLTLKVPAGAVSSPVDFTVEPITNLAHAGVGAAYRIGPDGTVFAKPATITFKTDAKDVSSVSIEGLRVAFQDAQGFWNLLPNATYDGAAGMVSVETPHLTDYSLVSGTVLIPQVASVKVGQTQPLEINVCYLEQSEDPLGVTPLGFTCTTDVVPLLPASGWSVNGQAGGNASLGTLAPSGSGYGAVYTAPAKAPSPPDVAVTVKVGDKVTLFSQIKVVEDASDMTGTFTLTSTQISMPDMQFVATGTASLTFADEGPDETNYEMSGQVELSPATFNMGEAVCTIDTAVLPIENQGYFKVLKQPAPAVRWTFSEMWNYTCSAGGYPYAFSVVVMFATTTGSNCTDFADVPITDVSNPSGSYEFTCNPGQKTSGEWSFH